MKARETRGENTAFYIACLYQKAGFWSVRSEDPLTKRLGHVFNAEKRPAGGSKADGVTWP